MSELENNKNKEIYDLNQDCEYYKEKFEELAKSAKKRINEIALEKENLKEKL